MGKYTLMAMVTAAMLGCGGGGAAPAPVATPGPVTPPVVTPPVPVDPLASMRRAIADSGKGGPGNYIIVGFGSSVGVGAALPDPTTQAPVAYFGVQLKQIATSLAIQTYNRSVNGSVVSQMVSDRPNPTGYWGSYMKERKAPNLVIIAYGMNDGFPGAFNTGQTFPWVYKRMVEAIYLARAEGAEVIVMTTPHPSSSVDWSMPAGDPQMYPVFLNPGVGPEFMTPAASKSIIRKAMTASGKLSAASDRHMQVNEALRRAAADAGAFVIDAERAYFEAVELHGTDAAFYNPGDLVHPNLLAHQSSYQKAIDAFLATLVK